MAKTPTARSLITKSRRLWDAYCRRDTKANLLKVKAHIDTMAESDAKTVKAELAKVRRVFNAEWKDKGYKAVAKKKAKRKPAKKTPRVTKAKKFTAAQNKQLRLGWGQLTPDFWISEIPERGNPYTLAAGRHKGKWDALIYSLDRGEVHDVISTGHSSAFVAAKKGERFAFASNNPRKNPTPHPPVVDPVGYKAVAKKRTSRRRRNPDFKESHRGVGYTIVYDEEQKPEFGFDGPWRIEFDEDAPPVALAGLERGLGGRETGYETEDVAREDAIDIIDEGIEAHGRVHAMSIAMEAERATASRSRPKKKTQPIRRRRKKNPIPNPDFDPDQAPAWIVWDNIEWGRGRGSFDDEKNVHKYFKDFPAARHYYEGRVSAARDAAEYPTLKRNLNVALVDYDPEHYEWPGANVVDMFFVHYGAKGRERTESLDEMHPESPPWWTRVHPDDLGPYRHLLGRRRNPVRNAGRGWDIKKGHYIRGWLVEYSSLRDQTVMMTKPPQWGLMVTRTLGVPNQWEITLHDEKAGGPDVSPVVDEKKVRAANVRTAVDMAIKWASL